MVFRAAELPAVIRQNSAHRQAVLPVKRQHVVVQQRGGALRLLPGMQKAEGIGAVGVHAGVEIHLPYAL